MRAVYCHTSQPGGAELAAPLLAQALSAELWYRGSGPAAERARAVTSVHTLPDAPSARPRTLRGRVQAAVSLLALQWDMLRRLNTPHRPEVLVLNSIQGLLHAGLSARLLRIPTIVYVRDLGHGGDRPQYEVRLYEWLIRACCRGVICNSELTRRSWKISLPTVVARTAVPTRFFTPQDTVEERTFKPGTVVIVGRLSHWKGQREVVQALNLLARDGTFTGRLVIVGGKLFDEDVPLPPAMFEMHATGYIDDPERLMRDAELVVHASVIAEPLGQVLAQAAALGTPIVCSSFGGHLEWLSAGEACVTADPRDPMELSRSLRYALENPAAMARRAAVARREVGALAPERAYAHLNDWIGEVCGNR